MVEFTIRNDHPTRTVTAWHVQARVTNTDGSIRDAQGLGVDAYASAAGALPGRDHLAPGATATRSFRVFVRAADATSVGVDVRPVMAVFDDLTAAGDPQLVEFIFKQRARDRRAWQGILAALEKGNARTGVGVQALQIARAELTSPQAEDGDHPSKQTIRINLDAAIRNFQLGQGIGPGVDEFIEEARRRLAAVTAHSRAQ